MIHSTANWMLRAYLELLRPANVAQLHPNGIDDDGAGLLEIVQRRREDLHDLRIRRLSFVRLPQHGETRPLQAVALKGGTIVRERCGTAAGSEPVRQIGRRHRERIGGILTNDHLEHRDGIFQRARHRAGDIGQHTQRDHTSTTRQAHRRTNAGERLV